MNNTNQGSKISNREEGSPKGQGDSLIKKSFLLDKGYVIQEKIGRGTFGAIYKALYTKNQDLVAVKVLKKGRKDNLTTFHREIKALKEVGGCEGFPTLYAYGKENKSTYVILTLFGKDLERTLHNCGGSFSTKTTAMIGLAMLNRLECLHNKGFIHRDLKPENILVGLEPKQDIYLVDFGISKRYIDEKNMHIQFTSNKGLAGTVRYCSINSHSGNELSRRDDIESLGYILVYLAKGYLPWQDLQIFEKDKKYSKIKSSKETIKPESLCKGLPIQFKLFFDYCKTLEFEDKPDYNYLKELFSEVLKLEKTECDWRYDWVKEKHNLSRNDSNSRLESNSRKDSKKLSHVKSLTSNVLGQASAIKGLTMGGQNSSITPVLNNNSFNNQKQKLKLGNQLSVQGSAFPTLDTSKQALLSLNSDYDFENIDEYKPAKAMSFVSNPKFIEKLGCSQTLLSNAGVASSFACREKIFNWSKDEENLTFDDDEIRRLSKERTFYLSKLNNMENRISLMETQHSVDYCY